MYFDTFIETKIWGEENIKKTVGPKIFCSNHFSSTDPFFALAFIKEKIHIIIGPGFSIPIVKNFLKMLGHIDALEENRKNVVNEASEYLNLGESIYIYPEGDLNNQDNFLNFYKGVAKIYMQTNIPIIPIGIVSPKRYVKEKKLFKIKIKEKTFRTVTILSGKYYINIGEPVTFPDLINSEDKESAYFAITNTLEIKIKDLINDVKFEKFWN